MTSALPTSAPDDQLDDRLAELVAAAQPSAGADPTTAEHAARELRRVATSMGDETVEIQAGVWLCLHLLQRGELRRALIEAAPIRRRLRRAEPGSPLGAARLELLRTIALAASETAQFDIALAAAQELARDPRVHADAGAAFDAAFSLAVCLERMGDSWQALRILSDVIERHGDSEPSFPMLIALNGVAATAIGAFHRVADLDATEIEATELLATARDAAERALELMDEFGTPLYEVAIGGNLGEVLMYQGELEEAERLLRAALDVAVRIEAEAHGHRVRATIGRWLHLAGRADESLEWLTTLIDDLGDECPHSTRIRAHHSAYLAARALGRFETALGHLEMSERLERQRTNHQLRSQSEMFVTRSEAEAEADRYRSSAERDPLTGLGNRRQMERSLRHLLPLAADQGRPLSLAVLDVDHFKAVNDAYGHAVGDSVLIELAHVLRAHARDTDVVIRHGGEEIVLILPDTAAADAFECCERLRAAIAGHSWPGLPDDHRITASVGVATTPPYDAGRLLHSADEAMYAAKRAGRNVVRSSGHAADDTPSPSRE